MTSWSDGSFEFHATLEPNAEDGQMVMPVEAALLEAARFIDESARHGGSPLPLAAGLRIEHRKVDLRPGFVQSAKRACSILRVSE